MINSEKKNIVKKIANILKTDEKKLIKIDKFSKFETWDSLVHLEILSVLEKNFGNKLSKIKNFSELNSLKKILAKIN